MEPFKPKSTILDAETVKDTLSSSIVKPLTVQKKPVKFTWQGLANFASVFDTTPFSRLKRNRIKELREGAPAKEKDYIDFFEDMEKSVYGAAQNILYSVGDLLTTGIDMAADTNLTQALDKAYEENKIKDPETLLGWSRF